MLTPTAGLNFNEVLLRLGVHAKISGEKEVVRELENDQHVSLEANVSCLPFIFFNLSGFSIFASNHTSSQGCYLPDTSTIAVYIVYVIESATYGVLFTSCLRQKPERARVFDTYNE